MKTLEEIRQMQLESMRRDMEHRSMVLKHENRFATINQGINLVVAMNTANILALLSIEK